MWKRYKNERKRLIESDANELVRKERKKAKGIKKERERQIERKRDREKDVCECGRETKKRVREKERFCS